MTTPSSTIRTGGPIDALCTKCGMDLTHTIIAMVGPKVVKVQCNTCGADHVYRGEQPLIRTAAAPARTAKKAAPTASRVAMPAVRFEALLQEAGAVAPRAYSPREHFKTGDILEHVAFGTGVVTAVRGNKVDVTFRTSTKTLVHLP